MGKYSVVYIDADDTIFDYRAAEKYALERACNVFRIPYNDEIRNQYTAINNRLWFECESGNLTLESLRTDRFRLLFGQLKTPVDEFEFSKEYLKWLSRASFLINGAEEICKYLSEKYVLAIITNGIAAVQRSRLDSSIVKKYITHIIISEEAKSSKPNIGIFNFAETIVKYTDKEKMIIIGDSLSSDIQGGINYGIDTCWFNPNRIDNDSLIKPKIVINSLNEIRNYM